MAESPQVLLLDGMSLLVRAAKAGAKMSHLSHHGVSTSTLVAFTGSLVRHLRLAPWDYVLVSWEGERQLNWRQRFYPEYKSNRPLHASGDAAQEMSQDEVLAREFCTAAGLYQAQQANMEGDDIIAAAWRLFRQLDSCPQITIVSDDRDLLQLTDASTVWRAWTTEVSTAAHVREIYTVRPERLPLLRALAGDSSDGIPGIKGIGPVTAANLIDEDLSDLENIRLWAVKLGLESTLQVFAWWLISDLRHPVLAPRLDLGPRGEAAAWHPDRYRESFREFLAKYGLNRLMIRMEAGDLPWAT